MPVDYVRALPHPPRGDYASALSLLVADETTLIAHIDSGVAPHPAFGWSDPDAPPEWLLLDQGRNFHDPAPGDARPLARMKRHGWLGELIEYPDHGVKTLSALCADAPGRLRGVVPGARVVPYRVSNGPLFRRVEDDLRRGGQAEQGPAMPAFETAKIGEAIDHALALPRPAKVMTVSMGNPAGMGVFEPVRQLLGGETGMSERTAEAVDRAYEAGAIVCCAAGQVIDSVVYPARYKRTIGVAGYDAWGTGGQCRHYPPGGYAGNDAAEFVDVWCQAMRINRAGYALDAETPAPEYAETSAQGEPSGTSYACPQAAGAAALWRSFHGARLESLFGRPGERWKIVEAFRHALRESGAVMLHEPFSGPPSRPWTPIPTLDVPALLAMEPRADWPLEKRSAAARANR